MMNESTYFAHLCGSQYSSRHKFMTGTFVMFIGVFVAKSAIFFEIHIIHYVLDAAGYLLHGIGAIPYAEHVIKKGETDEKN